MIKIIASIGPSCAEVSVMRKMIIQGAEIIRINASHSFGNDLEDRCRLIRRAAASAGKKAAVLIDLQGPRLRTGSLMGHRLKIRDGQSIRIQTGTQKAAKGAIAVAWPSFSGLVKKGSRIQIDNGLIALQVTRHDDQVIECRVLKGGWLGENKGINLPDVTLGLPVLTDKDIADLKTAVKISADYVALSFVRSHHDILKLRDWMRENSVRIPIVAKLEKPSSIRDAKLILKASEAVMVARGDLGVEMGLEKVPAAQREVLEMGKRQKKPVMVATHFLESMIENPMPTRAEVSDIANTAFSGAWGLVLTAETAIGKYPVEAVRMMKRIIRETQKHTS